MPEFDWARFWRDVENVPTKRFEFDDTLGTVMLSTSAAKIGRPYRACRLAGSLEDIPEDVIARAIEADHEHRHAGARKRVEAVIEAVIWDEPDAA